MSALPQSQSDAGPAETVLENPHPRPPHPLPESIGPYRIIEVIGEGGMGVVYKGEQRDPVRRVAAVKVIKLGMDTREIVARFDTERQALALMSHPNVAKVFEAGMTEQGRPFFAMEFVPGVPITHYCDTAKLTTRERLELFIPVCQAVQHAHQKGIIHRDLKPSNILVTLVDGKPVPKVIDFGVAKATGVQLTQHTLFTHAGTIIGTLEYMSPEQATGSGLDVDTRTDVYSLGVILYQLLTGSLPFEPGTLRKAAPEKLAHILQNTDPPKPSQRLTASRRLDVSPKGPDTTDIARRRGTDVRTLRRELEGDLDWIVLRAMEKDRTRRYESASAFAADVRRHLDLIPVDARPPSTRYKLEKFVMRHRLGVVAASAVGIALVSGFAAASYGLVKADRATINERSMRQRAEGQTTLARQREAEAREAQRRAEQFAAFSQNLLASVASQNTRRFDVQILDDASRDIGRSASGGNPLDECHMHLQLARRYVAIGFHRRAISQFASALTLIRQAPNPTAERITLLNEFADALLVDGKVTEAEKLVREAATLAPTANPATATAYTLDLLGNIEVATNRLDAAEEHLLRAAEMRRQLSNAPASELRAADSLAHRGNLLLLKKDPNGTHLLQQAFQLYLRDYPGRAIVGPMRGLAHDAARRGDWPAARRYLEQTQPARNADPGLLQDLIDVQNGLISLKPDDVDLLTNRGIYYARLGEFERSSVDYQHIIQLHPEDADSDFRYLSIIQLTNPGLFIAHRHESLRRFQKLSDSELTLQIAKSALAFPIRGDDLALAQDLARRAFSLNPGGAFQIQCMGMAEFRAGHYGEAIDYFARSRDTANMYRNTLNDFYSAMAIMRLGDRARAQAAFSAASAEWTASAPVPGTDDLRQFREYILCSLAQDEAKKLIANPS